jgi:uncharacterized alpha-E superfamily protein
VVLDADRSGSVMFSLRAMLNAVDQVKDYMSADTQRILNDLDDQMAALPARLRSGLGSAPEEELDALVTALLALAGLAKESMVRGHGWQFLDMGRRIERGLQTISLLRSLWVPAISAEVEYLALESALLCTEALMTYRRRYQGEMNTVNGLDLLLLDPTNPRALAFQLDRLNEHLASLPPPADGGRLSREERLLLEATSSLRLADLGALAGVVEGQYLRGDLDQLLSRIQHLLGEIAHALGDRYFDHTAGPQPMTPSGQGGAP